MLGFQVANYILIKSTILLWTVTIFVTVSTFITPVINSNLFKFYYVYRECVWLENYNVNSTLFKIFSGSIISKSISLKTDLHDHSNINNLLVKVNVIVSNKIDIKDIAENFVILTAIFLGLNILICFVWTAIANLTKTFWIHAAFLCFVCHFCVVHSNSDSSFYIMFSFNCVKRKREIHSK